MKFLSKKTVLLAASMLITLIASFVDDAKMDLAIDKKIDKKFKEMEDNTEEEET